MAFLLLVAKNNTESPGHQDTIPDSYRDTKKEKILVNPGASVPPWQ
jgi:hypothetical protein